VENMLRGEIYLATVENSVGGSVQNIFQRPMIIISNNMAVKHSPILHAIPLTSRVKRWMPTHVEISASSSGLVKNSTAMCEQLMLLPKESFTRKIGTCDSLTMDKLEDGLMVQFGMFSKEPRNNFAYA